MFIQYKNKMINLSKVNLIWINGYNEDYTGDCIHFFLDGDKSEEFIFSTEKERDIVLNQIIDLLYKEKMLYKLHD